MFHALQVPNLNHMMAAMIGETELQRHIWQQLKWNWIAERCTSLWPERKSNLACWLVGFTSYLNFKTHTELSSENNTFQCSIIKKNPQWYLRKQEELQGLNNRTHHPTQCKLSIKYKYREAAAAYCGTGCCVAAKGATDRKHKVQSTLMKHMLERSGYTELALTTRPATRTSTKVKF